MNILSEIDYVGAALDTALEEFSEDSNQQPAAKSESSHDSDYIPPDLGTHRPEDGYLPDLAKKAIK
jgi:hypothetical protein